MTPIHFNHLYKKYWYILLKFASKSLQPQDAEDAVSYTLVKLWQKDLEYDGVNELRSWLFITLKRRILDIKKMSFRHQVDDLADFDIEYTQKEIELFEIEQQVLNYLTVILKSFTPKEKEVFDLYFFKQLSIGEIIILLKSSPQTISNQIYAIRQKLNIKNGPKRIKAR